MTLGGLIQVANHHAASFNPAVSLGLTLFQVSVLENEGGYLTHYFYAYFLGPIIGGILAGIFSRIHNPLLELEEKPRLPAAQEEERAALLENEQQRQVVV